MAFLLVEGKPSYTHTPLLVDSGVTENMTAPSANYIWCLHLLHNLKGYVYMFFHYIGKIQLPWYWHYDTELLLTLKMTAKYTSYFKPASESYYCKWAL